MNKENENTPKLLGEMLQLKEELFQIKKEFAQINNEIISIFKPKIDKYINWNL